MDIDYICEKCHFQFEVSVTSPNEGLNHYRPPGSIPHGGYVEPAHCECGHPVNEEKCHEKADEKHRDWLDKQAGEGE